MSSGDSWLLVKDNIKAFNVFTKKTFLSKRHGVWAKFTHKEHKHMCKFSSSKPLVKLSYGDSINPTVALKGAGGYMQSLPQLY